LTEEGEVLTSLARAFRAESVAAERELKRVATARSMTTLLIGASPATAGSVLPGAITRFLGRAEGCRASVRTGLFDNLLEGLLKGELDILVCHLGDPLPGEVREHLLYHDDFVIVGGAASRLAREGRVDTEALVEAMWVLPPQESTRYADLSRAFASLDMPMPVARVETLSIELIRGLLLSGEDWVTPLPREIFGLELKAGQLVVLREAREAWSRPMGALTRRAVTKATAYIPCILECLAEEVKFLQSHGRSGVTAVPNLITGPPAAAGDLGSDAVHEKRGRRGAAR